MKDLQGRSIKIINKTYMCSDGMIYKKRIKSKKKKIAKDDTGKMQDKLHINPHRRKFVLHLLLNESNSFSR